MHAAKEIRQLLAIIDQAYNRTSWHGTNLRGSIRRVTVHQAAWRPDSRRHNIWEIVVHAAYWKYIVWRRLTGSHRGSFSLKGSDWFLRPESTPVRDEDENSWKEDIALLDRWHSTLRDTVAKLRVYELHKESKGNKRTNFFMISGIAAHDAYHAGQIQLLKKLWTQK